MHVMDHYSRRNGKKNSQVRQIWRRNNEHILFKKMVKENDRLKEKTKNKKKEIKKAMRNITLSIVLLKQYVFKVPKDALK